MGLSKVILTESLLQFWIDDYANPTCALCETALVVGDELDGYYPFHVEHNRCRTCKDKGFTYDNPK